MNKKNLRIVFMGTPNISAYVLSALIADGYQIVGVVAQPDRPVGRKKILESVPTKKVALEHDIPVFQPIKIRQDYEFIRQIKPDIIITLAYGQIVPHGLLEIPQYGCLNLHGSLLPKYRGAAPIQYALINNEKVTGMTLMEMVDKMDAGRIYQTKEIIIDDDDNSSSLFQKMAIAAKELILEALPKYIDGELIGVEQNESLVTFSPSIKSEEEKINLSLSTSQILGYIRALSEEPGAYLFLDNEKFKILKAKYYSSSSSNDVGKIIQADKNGLLMQCKDGVISLLEVQKAGKNKMDYKSFLNGNKSLLGKVLK